MFNAIRRAGKDKMRVQYDLIVVALQINLPDGTMMRIRWKRGSSAENRTMDREVRGGRVVFNDAMTIICTLWYDQDEDAFLEKESTLQILQVDKSSGNPIKHCSLTFPLDQHACYGQEVESKSLEFPVGNGGMLGLELSSRSIDKVGADSEEFSGSDRSDLNEYPFDWDEPQDWEKNAPAIEEMEVLQAELDKERRERGGQLQDLHDEMVSLDEEVKQCRKNEIRAQKLLAEAEQRNSKIVTENSILKEELEAESRGARSRGDEQLLAQLDQLQAALSQSQSDNQVLQVSCSDLHSAVAELEKVGQEAAAEKARADKLEKENRRLTATVNMLQSELDGAN
eukprot:TRINITY_DN21733_c0_g1_i2.p1 TRINITY_DN21733_c0_g1~~TRINITY_DN21733_c0_g1_i2.p1  ORF type:complete len:340 (-),score=122.66 TRINITY_DN21733_c0_g1_i2:144-1163(-)